MPKYYVVNDILGLNGTVIEGIISEDSEVKSDDSDLIMVTKIISKNVNVGDRNVMFPVPHATLYIAKGAVNNIESPETLEFASDNPYGKFILEGKMECGGLRVSYAQFEKVMTVTVFDTESGRTVISQNFVKDFDSVKAAIETVLKEGDSGAEDLVFKLQELKEAENNG